MRSRGGLMALAGALALASVPIWSGGLAVGALALAMIYLSGALMWGFLAEYAGIVSLGQQLFVGLGAYGMVIFGKLGLSPWAGILASSGLAAALALALSPPLFRLRGMYFAVGSWIAAEIFLLMFNVWGFVGAGAGVTYRPALSIPMEYVYYGALALALLASVTIYYLHGSKLGLGLRALGSDELAAAESGVDTFRMKAMAFALSAAFTAASGSLYTLYTAYIIPSQAFAITWVVAFIFISVVGGTGRITGAFVGAGAYVALSYVTAGYPGWGLLLEGASTIAIWLLVPRGLWGTLADKLGLRRPV